MDLANLPFVVYLDRPSKPKQIETPLFGHDLSLNKVSLLQSIYSNFNGKDIVTSIKEGPVDVDDIDLAGRVLLENISNDSVFTRHATEMATIAVGAGNTSPDFMGVASGALLLSSTSNELTPDDEEFLVGNGVSVQNHSYGVGIENYYGIEAYLYDHQTYNNKSLLHVFSSGNRGEAASVSGNYNKIQGFSNITGQFKVSKNTICVGASDPLGEIWEFSSNGPTNDGRIKPEVVAYGSNGSSESAALVTGLTAVLQQAHMVNYGQMPNSSLIKATIINSADNAPYELTHKSGFGNVDAVGSMEAIISGSFFEDIIITGGQKEHEITVPIGTKEINITLVWNDPPADMGNSSILVNDLDLKLVHPEGGRTWRPWVMSNYPHKDSLNLGPTRTRDSLNNIEKISVENPEAGEYLVQVRPYDKINNEGQEYSIVFGFDSENEWLFPVEGTKLGSNTNYYLRWDIKDSIPSNATLQWFDLDNGQNQWVNIADSINPQLGHFLWETPGANAFGKLRLISGNVVIESPTFIISDFKDFNIEYFCDTTSLISWKPEPEADGYNVYVLGNKYMEKVGSTTDTVFSFNDVRNPQKFVAVTPVINGKERKRTISKNVFEGFGCYIKDFFLKKPFSDKSDFTLILNSNIGVDCLILERMNGQKFETIEEYNDIKKLEYNFTDSLPNIGTNTYRIKVIAQEGKEYYSEALEFFLLNKNRIILTPVPANQGEEILLYSTSDDYLFIEVFDFSGRLLFSSKQNGLVRAIDTSKLYPGLYIVRITRNGFKVSKTIIVI
ncbi:S8 family peptidase [Maribacter polysiphoniae]|uniref:S8 family peptidase n=1 Tax=Maribacter polysiphoniae TaxID=429344 RepID=UPI00235219D5|nr:S8 family peptidase [Maribacter polysiphoniae]